MIRGLMASLRSVLNCLCRFLSPPEFLNVLSSSADGVCESVVLVLKSYTGELIDFIS